MKKLPLRENITNLRPSATLVINEKSAEIIQNGGEVYRLGFGQSPFPVPEEVTQALRAHAAVKDYLPVKGLPALREAVASFNQRTLNINCSAENVLIGPGSKELIYHLQCAVEADLLLPSPSWVSYEPQAELARKQVHWLPTTRESGWKLKASVLEDFCREQKTKARLLLLNYPNNPVGNTYTADELQRLAAVCGKYNVFVISDEIYAETDHRGKHRSIAEFYPQGTIISSGLSKWAGAGGWRLGTFTFPDELAYLADAMAVIASETFTSVSAPIQYAAVKAFAGSPTIEKYVKNSRIILQTAGTFVHKKLSELHLEMPLPQGGFYLFPDFSFYKETLLSRNITNSSDLCNRLLSEAHIALLPGLAFGRPSHELTTRLSYVDFDGGRVLKALENSEEQLSDEAFVAEHFPKLVAAVNALKEWLM